MPAYLVLLLTMATTSSPNTKLPRAMADRVPSVPRARLMASSSPQASWTQRGDMESGEAHKAPELLCRNTRRRCTWPCPALP